MVSNQYHFTSPIALYRVRTISKYERSSPYSLITPKNTLQRTKKSLT